MSKPTLVHDTERNEYARSSAGLETRPLSTVAHVRRSYGVVVTLALVSSLFLFNRLAPGKINWALGALLLTLAAGFLVAAVRQRTFAFCIPACILGGLSVGLPVVALLGPVPLIWSLAAGFVAPFFLGRALFNQREPWPLFPAGACFAAGLFLLVFG